MTDGVADRFLLHQEVDEIAIAQVRRDAPGGGVGLAQVPGLHEESQLVADGRGAPTGEMALGQRQGANRYRGRRVVDDYGLEHLLLAIIEVGILL